MIRFLKQTMGIISKSILINNVVPDGSLTIFMFHRVLPRESFDPLQENLYISPEKFEEILIKLKEKFKFIQINDWINGKRNGRACAITFDDGWRDNYIYAFPILKKHKIPATIFVCTGMIDTNKDFWFEKLSRTFRHIDKNKLNEMLQKYFDCSFFKSADGKELFYEICNKFKDYPNEIIDIITNDLEQLSNIRIARNRVVINWEEISEMSKNGISFGAHCVNHTILTEVPLDKARFEILNSFKELSSREINFSPIFSFPNGNYSELLLRECKQAGFQATVTASYRQYRQVEGYLNFPRIGVTQKSDINDIFFLIAKWMYRKNIR